MGKILIKLIEVRLLPDERKSLRAFADIEIGGVVLKDFRVMRENGGKAYVMAPFVAYKDRTGQLKFRQIIDLPAEVRGQVDVAILNAYYRREKEKHGDKRNFE